MTSDDIDFDDLLDSALADFDIKDKAALKQATEPLIPKKEHETTGDVDLDDALNDFGTAAKLRNTSPDVLMEKLKKSMEDLATSTDAAAGMNGEALNTLLGDFENLEENPMFNNMVDSMRDGEGYLWHQVAHSSLIMYFMNTLLGKEVFYPPMAKLFEEYPKYLEEKGDKLTEEEQKEYGDPMHSPPQELAKKIGDLGILGE